MESYERDYKASVTELPIRLSQREIDMHSQTLRKPSC